MLAALGQPAPLQTSVSSLTWCGRSTCHTRRPHMILQTESPLMYLITQSLVLDHPSHPCLRLPSQCGIGQEERPVWHSPGLSPTCSFRADLCPHSHSSSSGGHGPTCEYDGICRYPEYSRICGIPSGLCGHSRKCKQDVLPCGWPQRPNHVSVFPPYTCGKLWPGGQIQLAACFCK